MQLKPQIAVGFFGCHGEGKTTLARQLFSKLQGIKSQASQPIQNDPQKVQRPVCFNADKSKIEREEGKTVEQSFSFCESDKYQFTIINVPGHRNYMGNMIRGISQADAAVLVVSASSKESEIEKDPKKQFRWQLMVTYALGIKQLIVCINKMDEDAINWAEARYIQFKKYIADYVIKVGYKLEKVSFIPVSGSTGENLIEISDRASWYKGPTLIEAFDSLVPPSQAIAEKPLRATVLKVVRIPNTGIVTIVKVHGGALRVENHTAIANPSRLVYPILSVQMHYKPISEAPPGSIVGFVIRKISFFWIRPGDVVGERRNDPPQECVEFIAQILVVSHPTQIKEGYAPVLHCHTAQVRCRFEELIEKIDASTNKSLEEKPSCLKNGEFGIVRIKPLKFLCVEPFSEYSSLGRFVMRDMSRIVAVGIVKSVSKGKYTY